MPPALCLQPTERGRDHSSLRSGGREGPLRHGWVFAKFRERGSQLGAHEMTGEPGRQVQSRGKRQAGVRRLRPEGAGAGDTTRLSRSCRTVTRVPPSVPSLWGLRMASAVTLLPSVCHIPAAQCRCRTVTLWCAYCCSRNIRGMRQHRDKRRESVCESGRVLLKRIHSRVHDGGTAPVSVDG